MEQQIANIGEGISDIGAGIFFGSIAIAIAWHHIARMRWRSPLGELQKIEEMKADSLISEEEHKKLRKKVFDRF